MDRETVRMLLLVLGILVIAGVYVWGKYKEQLLDWLNRRGEFDEMGYQDEEEGMPASLVDEDETEFLDTQSFLPKDQPVPRFVAKYPDNEEALELESFSTQRSGPEKPIEKEASRAGSLGAPFLIQVSLVAGDDEFFNGEDLRDALVEQNLIFGDMGIYHRYDRDYREPLFSIASLVEPGTFPVEDMASFECPGIVLFFQPSQVADPLSVYDDLISTCHELAVRLDGVEWDERREPLTEEKIQHMRERLEAVY